MKFSRVKINKTDTCLTYVFKRLGEFEQEKTYTLELYDEYFDSRICDDINQLVPGDLIMWTGKEYTQQIPFEILENGMIITHNVLRGRHIGVVEKIVDENTILFSDCSRINSDVGIPQINLKNLFEQRAPDYVLNIKK